MVKKIKNVPTEYRGLHTAPMADSGAPLHDLTNIYPDDIYSYKAEQYYGHYGQNNNPIDRESIYIIQSFKGHPNRTITIYRAVPENLSVSETISKLENQKKYILRMGKTPPDVDTKLGSSAYYDKISAEIDRLKTLPETEKSKVGINPGDWVTINRKYAKEHGESQFDGKYKIIQKKVRAKDIFTNGDSIHEWGYDPQSPKAPVGKVGDLVAEGYIPIYRGAGKRGFQELKATEGGVQGSGLYFYTDPMPARSHATTGGGVITGYIKPEDAIIKGNVALVKDPSKVILRGKIPVEETTLSGKDWLDRIQKALSEQK